MSIIFPLGKSLCFVQKGSLLFSEESVFCIKGVPFMSSKVSVLKKRGNFFSQKVSGKGSLLNLENGHTSSLLQMSGGTGGMLKVGNAESRFMNYNDLVSILSFELDFVCHVLQAWELALSPRGGLLVNW